MTPFPFEMIGQTISHYKILEKLGEGGMGEVYLAEDMNLGRKVAVKFLSADKAADPESRKRFTHEARAQAMLSHQNIATFHEVGEEKEKVFIVMEYIEGRKLSELAKTEKLPLSEVLDLAIQVGEGLQAAHERGVMHRDINPTNILVTAKRVAKITDFGLAKWKGASTITRTGLQMGTDNYMSPEQVDEKKADHRTDIFSFGVVLYELICARRPFEGANRESLFFEILFTQPQPLARYSNKASENLQRIVSKCLTKMSEERYQSAADLVADLKKEKRSLEAGKLISFGGGDSDRWRKWLTVGASAAIVLLASLFWVFKVVINPGQEASAAQNSLAVMYFENLPDPEDKDKTAQMLTSLLITDLSESEYMSVVSQQRLYDVLKFLGKKDMKVVDKSTASEVAKKTGVKWILTGKIMQSKPNMVVTAEVSEAKGGKILASQRVFSTASEDLFAVVDRLSTEVKKDLSIPEQAKQELHKPVAEATTHSPEAYRYYLEGVSFWNERYAVEAVQSLKKALTFDSTFAMAYYRLAVILRLLYASWNEEAKWSGAQAVKFSDKATKKDKHYIKSWQALLLGDTPQAIKELNVLVEHYPDEKEAFWQLGIIYSMRSENEEAVRQFTKAIEIDPLYKGAYNSLAYISDQLGDFEKSIWAINKYISLAPEEANPYDSRGDLYAFNGKLDLAIQSYKLAQEKKPGFTDYASLQKLGHMYLFKREYVRAESCYQELFSGGSKYARSRGRLYLASIPLYQGKFGDALAVLDQGIAADRMERAEEGMANKHLVKATIYAEKKNLKSALEEVEKSVATARRTGSDDPAYGRYYYIYLLAEKKDFAGAEKMARALKQDLQTADSTRIWLGWSALGIIERAKGNSRAALNDFQKVPQNALLYGPSFPHFSLHFMLANTYLEAGRLAEAVAEFERLLSRYDVENSMDRLTFSIWMVKAYYLLGLAYEKSGWNQKAIENYEEFLETWKNADPGIPEVEDAKQRLARLKKNA